MFQAIVSGRRRGVDGAIARSVLGALEVPYRNAIRLRNWKFDHWDRAVWRAPLPVVSVGNLTLGGTGKTPIVAWLAQWLSDVGIRPAILSRGYGARRGEDRNDEALMLAARLPHIPHKLDADRVRAAGQLAASSACDLIILDDGFQHRRLARDLDIVMIDASEPFGYDRLFPRGTLREPLSSLRRAHVVVLSRADMIGVSERAAIRQEIRLFAPNTTWCEVAHRPHRLLDAQGAAEGLDLLTNKRVVGFCGIGNPRSFRHTLYQCGYALLALREYPDHHGYSQRVLEHIRRWACERRADAIVCTSKDLVKIKRLRLGGVPLWAVDINTEITSGGLDLQTRLRRLLADYGLVNSHASSAA